MRAIELKPFDGEFVAAPTRAEVVLALLRVLAYAPTLTACVFVLAWDRVELLDALPGGMPGYLRVALSVGSVVLLLDLVPKIRRRSRRSVRAAVFERGRLALPLALLAWIAAEATLLLFVASRPYGCQKM